MVEIANDKTLSVTEAAEYIGRHANTIRRWIHNGELPATRVGNFGDFKIKKSDLAAAHVYTPDSQNTAAVN